MGHLAPRRTIAEANAEMSLLMGQYAAAHPGKDVASGAWVAKAAGVRNRKQTENLTLARLLAIVAVALLAIACVNLAGLLIARGAWRAKEIALRLSLGAGRGRIVRQLLTESLVLSAAGGAAGLVLSLWTLRLLMSVFTGGPGMEFYALDPDWRTIACAAALSIATGLLFGILPALQSSRQDTAPVLRGATGAKHGARSVLVACQIGLSLALLVAAGLMARSVAHIQGGENFDSRHVALLRLRPRLIGYTPGKAGQFTREVIRTLENLPEVKSASLAEGSHGSVWGPGTQFELALPGEGATAKERRHIVNGKEIGPRFFETLRIPFVAGRDFDSHDASGSPRAAIVNQSLAAQYWPGERPLGRLLMLDGKAYRIVGIVKDAQLRSVLTPDLPMAYIPYWQNNLEAQIDSRLCVRVAGDPAAALPRLKEAIAKIDAAVPVTETLPMIDQVRDSFVGVRLAQGVLMSAAGLALLLTAIGVYGILAFVAGRRTREIGIRMAVGARPRQVLSLFLKQGLALAGIGSLLGLALAFAVTRLLASFLYGVPARDPISFAAGAGALLAVAAAATYIPSRRASRIDPMAALREE